MMRHTVLLCVFLFLAVRVTAQSTRLSTDHIPQMHAYEDTIGVLAFTLQNDTSVQQRLAACHQMIRILKTALKTPYSFDYPFERIKSISILAPPDSSFRIFTWQLFVDDSTYRYFGAIQMNSKDLKLYPLIDRGHEIEDPRVETLTHDRWLGSIYYNLMPCGTKKEPKYLLFGFDGYSFFEKQKVIDILHFDASGKPIFGDEIFDWPPDMQHAPDQKRIVLTYGSDAKVRCNYDKLYGMVLFDHLIPTNTSYGTYTYVPDGSLDGFKIEKGRLKVINKVFHDVQSEAPSAAPAADMTKDILGRKKKNGRKPKP